MMRLWLFEADMNFDGVVSVGDFWLWANWLFYYPGDALLKAIMDYAPVIAQSLDVSLDSFGGAASGLCSLGIALAITIAIERLRPRRVADKFRTQVQDYLIARARVGYPPGKYAMRVMTLIPVSTHGTRRH